jgi:hypothetical protein
MRVKVIGECDSARALRGLLRQAGFAVVEFLPADVVKFAPVAGYVVTIEEGAHSVPGKGSLGIYIDSSDCPLERNVLRHISQLTKRPVLLDRQGGKVHSDSEIRIIVPGDADAQQAVEFGVLRGLLDTAGQIETHTLDSSAATPTPRSLFGNAFRAAKRAFLGVLFFAIGLNGAPSPKGPPVSPARGAWGIRLTLPSGAEARLSLDSVSFFQQHPTGQFPLAVNLTQIAGVAATQTGGSLNVNCTGGCGGASSFLDNAAFTAGTTPINITGGWFSSAPTNCTDGHACAPQLTVDRMLFVNIGKINGTAPSLTGSSLNVNCTAGCSGSSFADNSAFTAGATTISVDGGVFNDGLAGVTSGNAAAPRITAQRAFHVNLRNNAGTEIGTLANPLRVDPTGTTTQPVSGTVTANQGTAGSNAQAWWTQIGDTTNGPVGVEPASEAAVAADPSLVVALSPNTPLPPGANAIGSVNPDQVVTGGAGALGALNNAVTITNSGGGWSDVNIILAAGAAPVMTVTFESSADGVSFFSRVCRQTDLTGILSTTTSTFPSEWRCNGASMNQFRVRVSSFTSGSTTANFRAGTGVGPVFLNAPIPAGSNIIGIVTTDQTTHGTTDLVAADVTKFGGTNISTGTGASGVGIPRVTVSNDSTVTANQGTANATPWNENVAQVGGTAAAATAKGTQATNGIGTQDLKDAGRTAISFYATAFASGATGVETAITLTKSAGTGATSNAVSFVVTSGKKFRITSFVVAQRGNTTANATVTTWNFRINTAGAVVVTSTPVVMSFRTATTIASGYDRFQATIPDGYEITGDGTLQIGLTANSVFTNAPTWDVFITGFEY